MLRPHRRLASCGKMKAIGEYPDQTGLCSVRFSQASCLCSLRDGIVYFASWIGQTGTLISWSAFRFSTSSSVKHGAMQREMHSVMIPDLAEAEGKEESSEILSKTGLQHLHFSHVAIASYSAAVQCAWRIGAAPLSTVPFSLDVREGHRTDKVIIQHPQQQSYRRHFNAALGVVELTFTGLIILLSLLPHLDFCSSLSRVPNVL